jgi:hypothetical protein
LINHQPNKFIGDQTTLSSGVKQIWLAVFGLGLSLTACAMGNPNQHHDTPAKSVPSNTSPAAATALAAPSEPSAQPATTTTPVMADGEIRKIDMDEKKLCLNTAK